MTEEHVWRYLDAQPTGEVATQLGQVQGVRAVGAEDTVALLLPTAHPKHLRHSGAQLLDQPRADRSIVRRCPTGGLWPLGRLQLDPPQRAHRLAVAVSKDDVKQPVSEPVDPDRAHLAGVRGNLRSGDSAHSPERPALCRPSQQGVDGTSQVGAGRLVHAHAVALQSLKGLRGRDLVPVGPEEGLTIDEGSRLVEQSPHGASSGARLARDHRAAVSSVLVPPHHIAEDGGRRRVQGEPGGVGGGEHDMAHLCGDEATHPVTHG